jgi:phospholipid-binding lipoprotein MlaA
MKGTRFTCVAVALVAVLARAEPADATRMPGLGGTTGLGGLRAAAGVPASAVVAAAPATSGAVEEGGDERPLPPGLGADDRGMHPDPLGGFNEPVFAFNRWLDDWVLRPVARGYGWVAPEPVRHAVTRFFKNVDVIPRVVNNVLQLRFERAGIETARFGINSTVGLAGFFDPAESWLDLEPAPNDFGLTCRTYGIPAGPYLMLPFFGPSTVTDAAGRVVDWFMNPVPWLVPFYVSVSVSVSRNAFEAINYRSLHLDQFAEVDRYAVDLYGAVQDVYLQHRAQRVEELRERAPEPSATPRGVREERTKPGRWRRVR